MVFMKYDEVNWANLNLYRKILRIEGEIWERSEAINERVSDERLFEVSNYGRVRRSDTGFVYSITDNGNGYKKVAIGASSKTFNFYIHRVVADAFLDNPNNLPQVNHKRTGLGKFDNRVEHLEWCTERDNILDAHSNGQMDYRTKVKTSIDVKSDSFVEEMYRRYKETGKVGGLPESSEYQGHP